MVGAAEGPLVDVPDALRDALASRYQIVRELGRGAMAIVYLARDLQTPFDVALKVLRPELALAVRRSRFHDEIHTLAGLVHPHIVSVHAHGDAGGYLYFAMEYVEGETLAQRIEREGPLPVADVLRIGREVADALAYAHTHPKGIIHRDIKPGNILLSADHAWVADFGIAKAVAGEGGVTESGFVIGTPAYMSPEQAQSGETVDGRSDVYSLGCVLFEALTGRPPFVGDTPVSVLAQHQTDEAPRVRQLRRDVPKGLDRIVRRCLAKHAADRFQTAAALCEALRIGDDPAPLPIRLVRVLRDRWRVVAGAAAAVGGLAWWLIANATPLDAKLIAVVPFGHVGNAAPELLNGDRCQSLITNALGRWTDIAIVDPMVIRSTMEQLGVLRLTFDDAKRVARAVGAGRLLWGEIGQPGDSLEVTAALYDLTRRGDPGPRHTVRIDRERSLLASRFHELADSLLLRRGPAVEAFGTRMFAAWEAYADGSAALERWELDSADRAFRAALEYDDRYAYAHLGLAHARAWSGRATSTWRESAEMAVAKADELGWRQRGLARALYALAEGQYPLACRRYAQLVAQDSMLFAAWFGLGDCHASDSAVVRDGASPSSWRFRSSYHTAATAYQRALRLVPTIFRGFRGASFDRLLARLQRVLFTETRRVRIGFAPSPDTLRFAAFPEFLDDSLMFVPYPRHLVFSGRAGVRLATHPDAVRHARETLRGIVANWTERFPASADVHEALALVLETTGEIGEAVTPERSALASVRRARTLANVPAQAARLAAAETRLLLKLSRFTAARRLADSTLAANPRPSAASAVPLHGLAALTGRANAAARLLALASTEMPGASLALTQKSAALHAYAALGAPVDSIVALQVQLDRDIEFFIPQPRLRPALRDTLLLHPAIWAWPILGSPRAGGSYVGDLQRAVARSDFTAVRRRYDELRALRRGQTPGEVAIDKTYQEARLLVTIGDSVGAAQALELSLGALATHGTKLLTRVEQAAAIGRAMELRVSLGVRMGDLDAVRRWARPLATLWGGADVPELRTVADSMEVLSRRVGA